MDQRKPAVVTGEREFTGGGCLGRALVVEYNEAWLER